MTTNEITFTVAGHGAIGDATFREVIDPGANGSPKRFQEITGPERAFKVRSQGDRDYVAIIHPSLVTVARFERAS